MYNPVKISDLPMESLLIYLKGAEIICEKYENSNHDLFQFYNQKREAIIREIMSRLRDLR